LKAHGIDMRGEFKVERVSTIPVWTSADEGREIYVVDEDKRYYGGSSDWIDYAAATYASATEAKLANLPYHNLLPDNGRFSGTTIGTSITISDGSYPFAQGPYFAPYNSGTIAQAGKFIHNNNDYGGTSGSMTQTTIDLLETQYLRSTNRYGVEYRIAEITAGSGTAASVTFDSGTKYLMTTNYGAWNGYNGWTTFGAWLRVTSGTIAIRGELFPYFTINGVSYNYTNVELTTSDNWIFAVIAVLAAGGYNNGMPLFYGTNGNKIQVALPAVFNGLVHPSVYWECPIVSNI